MSFIDGIGEGEEYGKERVYSQDDLNRVTPGGVVRWMNLHPALDTDQNLQDHPFLQEVTFVFHARSFNYLEFFKDGWEPNEELGNEWID
jgi:hypothetical protein